MEMRSFANWMFIIVPSDASQKEAVKHKKNLVHNLNEIFMLQTWKIKKGKCEC